MMKIISVIFLLILTVTVGCSPSENTDQENFIKSIRAIVSELRELQSEKLFGWLDNNLRPEGVDGKISEKQRQLDQLLGDKDRKAKSWNAEVDSLARDGSNILIWSSHGGHTYQLKIFDSEAKKIVEEIKAGDEIIFSGVIGAEASLTKTGATLAPEFHFSPSEILWKSVKITQPESEIKELNNEHDRLINQQTEDNQRGQFVTEKCRVMVLKRLKYPASGSFSWFKSELSKKSSNTWIYSDVISAKNELGGELPIRFICEGKFVKDDLHLNLNLLD